MTSVYNYNQPFELKSAGRYNFRLPKRLRQRFLRADRHHIPAELVIYAAENTAGGMHSWLHTNVGRIRKPNGTFAEPERLVRLAS